MRNTNMLVRYISNLLPPRNITAGVLNINLEASAANYTRRCPQKNNYASTNVLGRANAWSENAVPEGRQATKGSAFALAN